MILYLLCYLVYLLLIHLCQYPMVELPDHQFYLIIDLLLLSYLHLHLKLCINLQLLLILNLHPDFNQRVQFHPINIPFNVHHLKISLLFYLCIPFCLFLKIFILVHPLISLYHICE